MTYYIDITMRLGASERKAYLSVEAPDFGSATRTFEVWQSAVEAALPDAAIRLEGVSAKRRKGADPIPILATELLKTIFRPLTLKEKE